MDPLAWLECNCISLNQQYIMITPQMCPNHHTKSKDLTNKQEGMTFENVLRRTATLLFRKWQTVLTCHALRVNGAGN